LRLRPRIAPRRIRMPFKSKVVCRNQPIKDYARIVLGLPSRWGA